MNGFNSGIRTADVPGAVPSRASLSADRRGFPMNTRPGPEFLFCCSTGRSGTNHLAVALAGCEGVHATHEARPILNGRAMRWVMNGLLPASLAVAPLARSLQRTKRATKCSVRADVSHVFAKWYGPALLDRIGPSRCMVIRLWRSPLDVIRSFYEMDAIPGTPWGTHWMGDPRWKSCRLRLDPRNDAEAVAWHVVESWIRTEEIRNLCPGIRMVDLPFEILCDAKALRHWLVEIGLQPVADFEKRVSRVSNDKTSLKARAGRSADRAEIETAWRRVVDLARQRQVVGEADRETLLDAPGSSLRIAA